MDCSQCRYYKNANITNVLGYHNDCMCTNPDSSYNGCLVSKRDWCDKFKRKPYWIDNADSYICSNCGYECNNPLQTKYSGYKCPQCGCDMNRGDNIMKIKVKYFDKELYAGSNVLRKIDGKKSDWIDLRARENYTLRKGEFALVSLGVAIELPKGYEALLVPRSSTYKNFGVIQTNSIGVIDESYCGDNDEWKLPVLATRPTDILRGDRICQFRIIEHQPEFNIVEVESLDNEDRGGFGSTNVK